MTDDYSPAYKQAIALLAQRIYESGLLMQVHRDDFDWSFLWDSAVERLPELRAIAQSVEETLNYELSFNQCCNAIRWVYDFVPCQWAPLISAIVST